MKPILRKLSVCWVLLLSLFVSNTVKASARKDINDRINKVRKSLQDKAAYSNSIQMDGDEFNAGNPHEWVNWGNWANWNNWNNWVNWNNWSNWAKWGNF